MTFEIVDAPARPTFTLRARAFATAWLNAFLAASTDEERPALCRTLSLEFFEAGVQLIGCDGTALFRVWVPMSDNEEAGWPDASEAPTRSIVVTDPDGFGVGYMRTLLRVTADEAHELEELILSTLPADEGATLALGSEFMTERLTLRACGQRTDLLLFEGQYPDWRRLRLGMEAVERMDSLTVATRLFGLIGKLKAVGAVDLEFYGDAKHIAFVASGESEVRGLLMPMRRPVVKPDTR